MDSARIKVEGRESVREGLKKIKKILIEFSIKGWVGVSGGGNFLLKKIKNMPLKSILGHFKPF